MSKFYVVKKGRNPGIYDTWAQCEEQVTGYSGAEYKSFKNHTEALEYFKKNDENKQESFISEKKSTNYTVGNKMLFFNMEDDLNSMNQEGSYESKEDSAIAYVDGSYNEKINAYGYGVVFFFKDLTLRFNGPSVDKFSSHRNVAGEVKASLKAMEFALENNCKSLDLYYDYTGIYHWAVGDWKRNNEFTRRYYKNAQKYMEKLDVKFHKVEAHSGNQYNEEADRLAKEAVGIL